MNNIILKVLLIISLFLTDLFASGVQVFSKEVVGATSAKVGEVVTFNLKAACNSLSSDCGTLTIIDTLPNGMVIDSCLLPTGFTATQCAAGSNTIEITKDTVFNGGESFILEVKALVELDASSSLDIVNSATSVISSPDDPSNGTVTASSTPLDILDRVPNWKIFKTRTSPSSSLNPTWDTDVSYRVDFCSVSAIGNVDLTNVVIEDTFPTGATVVNDGGASSTTLNTLVWNLGDIDLATLYAGKSYSTEQCISKTYVLRYPSSSFTTDDAISNSVTATANRADTGQSISLSATVDDIIGIPTPGAVLGKSANDVLPNEDLVWSISANVDSSNAPVPDLKIYETFTPSLQGVVAKSITSGQWSSPATTNEINGSDVQARVMAATDSEGDCSNATYSIDLSGGFIPSPAAPITYNLDPATTCVRWEFQDMGADGPAVPRGWSMTTAPVVTEDTTGYAGALPVTVSNCIHATFTNFDGTTGDTGAKCGEANIENATPEIIARKYVSNSNVNPGEEVTFTLEFRHDRADSTGPTINPTVTDLLPAELEFISWDAVLGLNGEAEPNLEIIDNYNATGRTLLRFSWRDAAPANSIRLDGTNGVDNPASFDENSVVQIKFTARFKAGTLAGNYTNTMQFFDNSARQTCEGTLEVDSNDLDGDGDSSEQICLDGEALVVLQAAVLGGEKWIKGDSSLEHVDTLNPNPTTNAQCPNDLGFTRYPCVAQTKRSGAFEYLFKFINMGNEALNNYIVYDVLPTVDDVGVGEPLSTIARGTQWTPTLQGPIVASNQVAVDALAQTGATIEYSMSTNPCRPEVSATDDESGWQSSCDNDWTATPSDYTLVKAFRIKLPFTDSSWSPASELQFKATMKAPDNALVSDVNVSSKLVPAWNSFAHRATQASNGLRLPTAEPKRVGIVVPKGPSVSIGSAIWNDSNRNGLQDIGENLITEATIFRLKDAQGREVTDNDNVVVRAYTSTTGKYSFTNLPEGNYSVTVEPMSHYIASPIQTIADNDNNESDSNIKEDNGDGTYSSGIFELTNNSEPVESNSFQSADDLDDSDDDNGNMTVDFGFYRLSTLGDYVWYDANQNGIQDSTEKGVSGITVTLYQNCTTQMDLTTTDSNGKYLFTQLEAGDYCVGFSNTPAGYLFTSQGVGGIDDSDVNVDTNMTDAISLSIEGEDRLDIDAGIVTPILSGTIFDDGNNDGIVNGTPISNANGQLYVNLLDVNGNLLDSKAVLSDGTYSFNGDNGVRVDSTFFITLSITPSSSVGSLANNWNNADGEEIGVGAGLDGAADGKIEVVVAQDNVENINFGINEQPTANSVTQVVQFNPAGTNEVNVPDLNVIDREDGIPEIITITTLPSNATLYYKGSPVTVNQNISNLSSGELTVDPDSGEQTVTFNYTTTDKSGIVSAPATVTMPFKDLKISGNLFIDGNGDGNVNGTLTSSADGVQLYVSLLNGGSVVSSKALSGGSYEFDIEDGVRANTNYTVVLSDSNGTTTANLPTDWDNNDGENINSMSATGNDGAKDGVLAVNVVTSDVTQADFGINKRPEAYDVIEPTQINPGSGNRVEVPDLNISDGQTASGLSVTIITIPSNATLYYDGRAVTEGQVISDFNNTLLTIDPEAGDQNVTFSYTTTDAAGVESDSATVTLTFSNIVISGRLFNDGNGNGNVDGNATNSADATQLFVTLLDATGVEVASKPLDGNGTYYFDSVDGLVPESNYSIVLTTVLHQTSAALPANWNNADGENIGLVGLDGMADGVIAVNLLSVDIAEINFGINKKPIAQDSIEALHYNPGGKTQVVVPDLNISDREDGTPSTVTITALPTNGTLYYDGNEVTLGSVGGYEILDFNNSRLTFDPNDGDLTARFNYTTTDRAGVISDEVTVSMPFFGLKITGNIFNDGDNDGIVNGTGISAPNGVQLYVTLVDTNGLVVASHAVNGDGTYAFEGLDGLIADSNYSIVLSVEENSTTASLPLNWSNLDGEHIGVDAGTDGLNDGMIDIELKRSNIVEVNFGINKKPVAGDHTEPLQLNPGSNVEVNVPDLNISDNEDGTPKVVTIQTVPANGTLYYNGVAVVAGQVIDDLNNSLLTLDPDNGDQTVSFTFTTTDAVGVESDVATVSMSFDGLEILGNIFNDGNNDGTVNGTKISEIDTKSLFVSLLDRNGRLMATIPVINGKYQFTGVDGIVPYSNYSVVLSSEMNTVVSILLENWNHADGEHIGRGLGLDGISDGKIEVAVLGSDIVEVNFGINRQPIAVDKRALLKLNPGGDTQVAVPTLEISDNEDGTPKVIKITTLPSNATLYYNGGKVILGKNISNANLSNFTIDPNNGDLNVTFSYVSTDITGWDSKPATVVMPFDGLTISGQLFVDGNANSDVDGLPLTPEFGLPLFVTLIDDNGVIVSSIPVDSSGSYEFNATTGIVPNRSYTVVIGTDVNSSTATLPSNWRYTNSVDGRLPVTMTTKDLVKVDFGVNKQPIVKDVIVQGIINPDTDRRVAVPRLNILQNEDGTTIPTTVTLSNLPTNGTLYYNGIAVTEGQVIHNFNSTLLTVDPDDANVTVQFNYTATDDAGFESNIATVRMLFIDPDTDGDGITNSQDLDDDNDGILDSIEDNTSLNGGDSDGDGTPDRLDLDSDGDGILDLEESNSNPTLVDSDGDGVLDSTTDADQDGVMDVADVNDNDATSKGSVVPIDTDSDGLPDFQDIDSDNDGLSDVVEGGTDANLDANSDGLLDNQKDSDGDGIADVVDSDSGGTPATTPDTDGDGIDNYRDLDSDGDSLLDVIEVGGVDTNSDGYIEPVGRLVDGLNLPDENNNDLPDVLEARLKDDIKHAPAGSVVTLDLLENDIGDIDPASILLVIPDNFDGIARLSPDGKRLVVDGEGEWFVDEEGVVTFTPEAGFRGSPTSIMYRASNVEGTKSAVAKITIIATDVAGVDIESCETYSETSLSFTEGVELLWILIISSILGSLLIRRERD